MPCPTVGTAAQGSDGVAGRTAPTPSSDQISHSSRVAFGEPSQDRRRIPDIPLPRFGFQSLSRLRREVPVVLVDVDPGVDAVEVEFGVKLCGIDVLADAE